MDCYIKYKSYSILGVFGILISVWIILNNFLLLFNKVQIKNKIKEINLQNTKNYSIGMLLSHLGVGILILGITGSSIWQSEKIIRMKINSNININKYNIVFDKINEIKGKNYIAIQGNFTVYNNKNNVNIINSELDKLNADRVNKNMYINFREKNLIESILNNPDLLSKIDEELTMVLFSNNELDLLRIALIDLYKKNGNLSDLDVTELKNNIKYSKIFISIFKLNDWTKAKFTPDYVQKNDDLNYVEKCWIEAANLQKIWYKKNRN